MSELFRTQLCMHVEHQYLKTTAEFFEVSAVVYTKEKEKNELSQRVWYGSHPNGKPSKAEKPLQKKNRTPPAHTMTPVLVQPAFTSLCAIPFKSCFTTTSTPKLEASSNKAKSSVRPSKTAPRKVVIEDASILR